MLVVLARGGDGEGRGGEGRRGEERRGEDNPLVDEPFQKTLEALYLGVKDGPTASFLDRIAGTAEAEGAECVAKTLGVRCLAFLRALNLMAVSC